MKKKSFLSDSRTGICRRFISAKQYHPLVWLLMHCVPLIFLVVLPVRIESDLYSILPKTQETRGVSLAEAHMSAQSNSGVIVLAGHPDFSRARSIALSLANDMSGITGLDSVVCEVSADLLDPLRSFIHEYRFLLQDKETLERIRQKPEAFAADALSRIFMPFSVVPLTELASDPFLLTETAFLNFADKALLSAGSMYPREGVLTTEQEGIFYVLITAKTVDKGGSIRTEGHYVEALYHAQAKIKENEQKSVFYNSGVPFHSWETSRKAQREITLIAAVSLVLAALLLLVVFRSPGPLFLTIGAIICGTATAFSVTQMIFGSVHLLTLAFGTSLIGISMDYALHFFVSLKRSPLVHVCTAGLLGLITTLTGYCVLAVAPFSLLRQISVFSIIGLLSVFTTVFLVFPRVSSKIKPANLPLYPVRVYLSLVNNTARVSRRTRLVCICVLFLACIPGLLRLNFTSDIRTLYTMGKDLYESERMTRSIMNHGMNGWYYIIEADSDEEILLKEEALSVYLDKEIDTQSITSYVATSRYLPSLARQKESWTVIGDQLLPLCEEQIQSIGYERKDVEVCIQEWNLAEENLLTPSVFFGLPVARFVSSLWVGEVEGKYYSAVFPLNAVSPEPLQQIANKIDGVFFINKTADISAALERMSLGRLWLLLASFIVMVAILSVRFTVIKAIKLCAPPLLAVLVTLSILGYVGIPLNLFSIMALVLVTGIGVDYSIFLGEGGQSRELTFFGVMLCMFTTLFSFGALAFSSFAPVQTFGITLVCGILLAFIISPFVVCETNEFNGGK